MQIKKLRFRSLCTVLWIQTSQPQTIQNLKIKVKKREIWGKSWRFIDGDAVHQNKFFFSLYHGFPTFWQSGQNLSRRDKLVKRTLFGICHLIILRLWYTACRVNQSNKYDKYSLELCISTALAPKSQCYNVKIKIFNENICHRFVNLFTLWVFEPYRETVRLVYVIVWARGQLRINFTRIFKVFTKLPESRSDGGNLENFENTSQINP